MEQKPVRPAFGSPGGKTYLAPRLVSMIPPHEVYVEPYAGGAAVYFKKPPSDTEVLSDWDKEIAFAFRFLRDMTPDQYERLLRMNWKITRRQFDKVKAMTPGSDEERFYKFYYLKKASYGDAGRQVNPLRLMEGHNHLCADYLWRVHERLKKTKVHVGDALKVLDKYDRRGTFCYLDPPYPNRAFLGRGFAEWTEDDLKALVRRLQSFRGKFMLSLGTEHARLLPKNWHIKKVKVWRRIPRGGGEFNRTFSYEIVATNYDPDVVSGENMGVARRGVGVRKAKQRGRGGNGRKASSPALMKVG